MAWSADMAKDDLPLAGEFPAADRAQWLKLIDGVLKGAPFDKKLVSRTYDQVRIEPLYAREPGAKPVVGRAGAAPWTVMQRADHPDPVAANAEALHDLELVKTMFPEALLLAREPVAWGPTKDVLTAENLLKARRMCEAFDENAHECAVEAA